MAFCTVFRQLGHDLNSKINNAIIINEQITGYIQEADSTPNGANQSNAVMYAHIG
jgi:hypothetical protein